MSKLAHSNQATMDEIEAGRLDEMTSGELARGPRLPTALTVIKAIAAADGVLPGGENYLTKYRMIKLCQAWLKSRAHQ